MRIIRKLYNFCTILILLNFVHCENDDVESTLNLLKDANDNIEVKNANEVVLVFGTGTEKNSGFIKYVTGHAKMWDFEKIGNTLSVKDKLVAIKTSYPDLYYSKTTRTTFYDCTRFGDISETKDPMFSIVSSFYLKKITEKARSIKIVFLMEISNNENDNYNNGLLLLQQAKYIFTDISQYKKNMGVITTRANSQQNFDTRRLSQFVTSLNDPTLTSIYNVLFNQIARFDEAYLEGSVTELENTKTKTEAFINKLEYKIKNTDEFKRSLLPDQKELLFKMVDHINGLRKTLISEIAKYISDHFKNAEKDIDDIEDFKDEINKNLNKIGKMIDSYYDNLNAEIFARDISEYMSELNIEIPQKLNDNILKYDKLLNFFSDLDVDGSIKISSIQWVAELESAESKLDRLNCLYVFFKDFSDKLSDSTIADNEKTYNIKSYFNNLKTKKKERFDSKNKKFYTTIMKVRDSEAKYENSHLYYRVVNRTLTNYQFKRFYGIYDNAFNSMTLNCKDPNKITVTGYNIKLSEIELYHKNFEPCKDKNIIEIFARNRISIDEHFGDIFHKNIKYALIIAPTWDRASWIQDRGDVPLGPVIGIGYNFYNGETNLWDMQADRQDRLKSVNNLKIIDLNGNIKIDEFSKNGVEHPDLGDNINLYKRHLHEKLTDSINKRSFDQFLKALSANADVNKLYNVNTFYNNLNMLEQFYYYQRAKIDYVPLYETLTRGIQLYIENSPSRISDDLKEVQKKLYSAALSKVINLTSNKYNNLVLDHEKYLSFAMDNANEYKDANKIFFIGERNREYNKKINNKIEEGAQYIEKELKPETQKLQNQIATTFRVKLVKEIKELVTNATEDKRKLKIMIVGQGIATALGVIGTGISLLGPVGAGVGTAMNAAGGAITSLTSSPMPTVREDLKPKLESLQKFIKQQQQTQEYALRTQIQALEESKDSDILPIVKTALEYLDGLDKDKLEKAQTFVFEKLDNLQKKKPNLPKFTVTAIKKAKSFSKIATVSTELYTTFKDDFSKISSMCSLLEQKDAEIRNLVNLKNTISNSFVPLLGNMADDLTNQLDNMKDKSRMSIYIKQYKLQQTLGEFQKIIKDLTTGFEVQAEVLEFTTKVNRAIEATITIFDLIQNYEEQKQLVTYIADLHVIGMRENLIGGQYREMADNLTLFTQSNIVVDNYLVAVHSLKQYVFPFADFYSDAMFLSNEMKNTIHIRDLAVLVSDKIEELEKKTKEFTSTHNNDRSLDLMIYQNIPKTFAKPFYTWDDNKYRTLISTLLKGDEIILESEISHDTRNGLKFSEIEFSIKSHNPSVRKSLKELLNYFVVDLIHLGNSYYKCNSKVYVISSGSASLRHSFYKDADKKLIYESKLHHDLSNNKFILSPYASWKVKLNDETRRNDFSKLAALDSSEIYLELSGKGQYVPDGVKCDNNLEKYYKLDSILY